jgi:hypothetical protein
MGIFSQASQQQPYVPQFTPPPPGPTPVDRTVVDTAKRKQADLAASGGFGGTLLTGGQGVSDTATVQKKTLLGQ